MMKENNINTKKTSYLIKRFLPYFKKYKWVLILDLFCATLTTICDLVLPMIVRYLTDMGMNDVESLTVRLILTVGAIYLGLRVIDLIANYYMANIGHVMGAQNRDGHAQGPVRSSPGIVLFFLQQYKSGTADGQDYQRSF